MFYSFTDKCFSKATFTIRLLIKEERSIKRCTVLVLLRSFQKRSQKFFSLETPTRIQVTYFILPAGILVYAIIFFSSI